MLDGAKFLCLDENGEPFKEIEAKGRKFSIGYLMDCDHIIADNGQAEKLHCQIECDPFGRITIYNKSEKNPISVNGETVTLKRTLFHNSTIRILNKEYLWQCKSTDCNINVASANPDEMSTPVKQIGIPEPTPNSCPALRHRHDLPTRLTVHNLRAYRVDSDNNMNESDYQNEILKVQADNEENESRTQIPDSDKTPAKVDLVDSTTNKKASSTEKKLKNFRNSCGWSGMISTSYSPRETGVRIEKSFTAIIPPTTPRTRLCRTPQGLLERLHLQGERQDSTVSNFLSFSTPSKKVDESNKLGVVVQHAKSTMKIVDLTTPTKLRAQSPLAYPSSSKKPSAVKSLLATEKNRTAVEVGITPLPNTPNILVNDTPLSSASVITVDSSRTSDVSQLTDSSAVSSTTPLRSHLPAVSGLRKQALLASAKKQTVTHTVTSSPKTPSNISITSRKVSTVGTPYSSKVGPGLNTQIVQSAKSKEVKSRQLFIENPDKNKSIPKLDISKVKPPLNPVSKTNDISSSKETKLEEIHSMCQAEDVGKVCTSLATSTPYKTQMDENKIKPVQLEDNIELFGKLHSINVEETSTHKDIENACKETILTVDKKLDRISSCENDDLLTEMQECLRLTAGLDKELLASLDEVGTIKIFDEKIKETTDSRSKSPSVSKSPEPTPAHTANKSSTKTSASASILLKAISSVDRNKTRTQKGDEEKENKVNANVSMPIQLRSVPTPSCQRIMSGTNSDNEEITAGSGTLLTPKRITKRRLSISFEADEAPATHQSQRIIETDNTENMEAIVEEDNESFNIEDGNECTPFKLPPNPPLDKITIPETPMDIKDKDNSDKDVNDDGSMSPLYFVDESFAETIDVKQTATNDLYSSKGKTEEKNLLKNEPQQVALELLGINSEVENVYEEEADENIIDENFAEIEHVYDDDEDVCQSETTNIPSSICTKTAIKDLKLKDNKSPCTLSKNNISKTQFDIDESFAEIEYIDYDDIKSEEGITSDHGKVKESDFSGASFSLQVSDELSQKDIEEILDFPTESTAKIAKTVYDVINEKPSSSRTESPQLFEVESNETNIEKLAFEDDLPEKHNLNETFEITCKTQEKKDKAEEQHELSQEIDLPTAASREKLLDDKQLTLEEGTRSTQALIPKDVKENRDDDLSIIKTGEEINNEPEENTRISSIESVVETALESKETQDMEKQIIVQLKTPPETNIKESNVDEKNVNVSADELSSTGETLSESTEVDRNFDISLAQKDPAESFFEELENPDLDKKENEKGVPNKFEENLRNKDSSATVESCIASETFDTLGKSIVAVIEKDLEKEVMEAQEEPTNKEFDTKYDELSGMEERISLNENAEISKEMLTGELDKSLEVSKEKLNEVELFEVRKMENFIGNDNSAQQRNQELNLAIENIVSSQLQAVTSEEVPNILESKPYDSVISFEGDIFDADYEEQKDNVSEIQLDKVELLAIDQDKNETRKDIDENPCGISSIDNANDALNQSEGIEACKSLQKETVELAIEKSSTGNVENESTAESASDLLVGNSEVPTKKEVSSPEKEIVMVLEEKSGNAGVDSLKADVQSHEDKSKPLVVTPHLIQKTSFEESQNQSEGHVEQLNDHNRDKNVQKDSNSEPCKKALSPEKKSGIGSNAVEINNEVGGSEIIPSGVSSNTATEREIDPHLGDVFYQQMKIEKEELGDEKLAKLNEEHTYDEMNTTDVGDERISHSLSTIKELPKKFLIDTQTELQEPENKDNLEQAPPTEINVQVITQRDSLNETKEPYESLEQTITVPLDITQYEECCASVELPKISSENAAENNLLEIQDNYLETTTTVDQPEIMIEEKQTQDKQNVCSGSSKDQLKESPMISDSPDKTTKLQEMIINDECREKESVSQELLKEDPKIKSLAATDTIADNKTMLQEVQNEYDDVAEKTISPQSDEYQHEEEHQKVSLDIGVILDSKKEEIQCESTEKVGKIVEDAEVIVSKKEEQEIQVEEMKQIDTFSLQQSTTVEIKSQEAIENLVICEVDKKEVSAQKLSITDDKEKNNVFEKFSTFEKKDPIPNQNPDINQESINAPITSAAVPVTNLELTQNPVMLQSAEKPKTSNTQKENEVSENNFTSTDETKNAKLFSPKEESSKTIVNEESSSLVQKEQDDISEMTTVSVERQQAVGENKEEYESCEIIDSVMSDEKNQEHVAESTTSASEENKGSDDVDEILHAKHDNIEDETANEDGCIPSTDVLQTVKGNEEERLEDVDILVVKDNVEVIEEVIEVIPSEVQEKITLRGRYGRAATNQDKELSTMRTLKKADAETSASFFGSEKDQNLAEEDKQQPKEIESEKISLDEIVPEEKTQMSGTSKGKEQSEFQVKQVKAVSTSGDLEAETKSKNEQLCGNKTNVDDEAVIQEEINKDHKKEDEKQHVAGEVAAEAEVVLQNPVIVESKEHKVRRGRKARLTSVDIMKNPSQEDNNETSTLGRPRRLRQNRAASELNDTKVKEEQASLEEAKNQEEIDKIAVEDLSVAVDSNAKNLTAKKSVTKVKAPARRGKKTQDVLSKQQEEKKDKALAITQEAMAVENPDSTKELKQVEVPLQSLETVQSLKMEEGDLKHEDLPIENENRVDVSARGLRRRSAVKSYEISSDSEDSHAASRKRRGSKGNSSKITAQRVSRKKSTKEDQSGQEEQTEEKKKASTPKKRARRNVEPKASSTLINELMPDVGSVEEQKTIKEENKSNVLENTIETEKPKAKTAVRNRRGAAKTVKCDHGDDEVTENTIQSENEPKRPASRRGATKSKKVIEDNEGIGNAEEAKVKKLTKRTATSTRKEKPKGNEQEKEITGSLPQPNEYIIGESVSNTATTAFEIQDQPKNVPKKRGRAKKVEIANQETKTTEDTPSEVPTKRRRHSAQSEQQDEVSSSIPPTSSDKKTSATKSTRSRRGKKVDSESNSPIKSDVGTEAKGSTEEVLDQITAEEPAKKARGGRQGKQLEASKPEIIPRKRLKVTEASVDDDNHETSVKAIVIDETSEPASSKSTRGRRGKQNDPSTAAVETKNAQSSRRKQTKLPKAMEADKLETPVDEEEISEEPNLTVKKTREKRQKQTEVKEIVEPAKSTRGQRRKHVRFDEEPEQDNQCITSENVVAEEESSKVPKRGRRR